MGSLGGFAFSMFVFINAFSLLVAQESSGSSRFSAISFTLCEGSSEEVNFEMTVTDKTDKSVTTTFTGTTHQKAIDGAIEQGDVKNVVVASDVPICFQSLVVDTTIIVDQPTEFRSSCSTDGDVGANEEDALPCRELNSRVEPVLICPQALTELLMEDGIITQAPSTPGPQDFEAPTYDITNDMLQASSSITEGLTKGYGKIVKQRRRVFQRAKIRTNIGNIGRTLGSLASFLRALGPAFSIFSGVASIITNYLTPNPFDEMAKYLEREFDQVNARLTDIQDDIIELKRVVEMHGSMAAMAPKLQNIRYAIRNYGEMVDSLSRAPVCGSRNLIERPAVATFMDQYRRDSVENSLLDLYTVEFGGVLEAHSLLNPFMRAHCISNPSRVQRFMQEIAYYAYSGSLAHFAFKGLECETSADQSICYNGEDKKEWMKKLYRFMKKTNVLKEAAINPVNGLHLDLKDDLDKLFDDAIAEVGYSAVIPGIFDKVYDLIINKLFDSSDWPEACIINVRADRTVIVQVAQCKVNNYGSDFKPWVLYDLPDEKKKGLVEQRFRIKGVPRGDRTEDTGELWDTRCSVHNKTNYSCSRLVSAKPEGPPKDQILYFMFNPTNFQMCRLREIRLPHKGSVWSFARGPGTQACYVLINMLPIDVFYKEDLQFVSQELDKVAVGCYRYEIEGHVGCRIPSERRPNRATSSVERYFAFVDENEVGS